MDYLNMFSNCVLVRGNVYSVICDLQISKFHHIPSDMADVLDFLSEKSIDDCFLFYGRENIKLIKEYLAFIVDKNLGFISSSHIRELVPLDLSWDNYAPITNIIIEYNEETDYSNEFVKAIIDNNLISVEVRIYNNIKYSFENLERFLKVFEDSTVQSIYIVVPYSSRVTRWFNKMVKKYVRLAKVILHSSPYDKTLTVFNDTVKLVFIKREINSCLSCGLIHPQYFATNIFNFTESKNFNSCLNRKLSISANGEIKNCPSMEKAYGNMKDDSLQDILQNIDFKRYWNLTKDNIKVCQDCEFRYVCTDCRAYTERTHINEEDIDISKPLKCGYDPYTGKWSEWSEHPFKQNAINFYGLQDLVRNNEI